MALLTDTQRVPALVEPGPPLPPDRLARFSRQLLMPGFGDLAQRRLAAARVLVVGAGGLGSASIPYLAAAGVGTIGVIDSDVVELSNLHRQVSHSLRDVGRNKVDSIADTVAAIDPEVEVIRHRLRVDSSTILDILADYDLVLDGSDNFPTRYLTNDAAALQHKPLVWGAILQYSGQASVAWVDYGPTYRDLFPVPPAPGEVLSCSIGGVLPSVCAVIGAIMSAEAIKLITGIGAPLLGRVTTYDALSGRHRDIEYGSIPEAEPVTELTDYELFCGVSSRPSAGSAPEAIDVAELSRRLATGSPMQLVDVREPFEAQIARIDGSELIPLGSLEQSLERIRTDVPVVVYCHHGVRSDRAAAMLRQHGIANVLNLEGGIDAFAAREDPTMARY
ncbi:ThiF family adenylyltransferase [Parafrigoribacterium mesophilum]|uniref:ThiF family adenylyltransferase n=1 Tax=Parafrigoribacterium mesophilum TaxID=433646 RepID=UPI0031FDD094